MAAISYDDFAKLEIMTGKVANAEIVEGTDKLLKIEVEIGNEKRQIVAGIGKSYKPNELKDKNIIVLTNLEPNVIKGIKSEGMLLAASDGERPVLLVPEKDVPSGTLVR